MAAYDLVAGASTLAILVPVGLIAAAARRSSIDLLRERLGLAPVPIAGSRPRLLIHAVSAGEMAAAGALVEAMVQERGSASFVLTTGTAEGRAVAERLRGRIAAIQAVCHLPWDRHRAVRGWLEEIDPDGVVVVETEIWPGLFRAARDLSIPLSVVSGRLDPRSAAAYRSLSWFFGPVLECAHRIAVQNERERTAFVAAGAPNGRIDVMGNLKYDAGVDDGSVEPWAGALAEAQGSPLVVAASTHHPEDEWLADALLALRRHSPGARLLLAPRRVSRAGVVFRHAAERGLTAVRWSDFSRADEPWDVLVLDRVGPLAAACRWADIVVVGGSLVRRGGHNPLEAARLGRAVVVGPHHEHVRDVVLELEAADGVCVLPPKGDVREALEAALLELAGDPQWRRELGGRAMACARSQRGVARRCARAVLAELAGGGNC